MVIPAVSSACYAVAGDKGISMFSVGQLVYHKSGSHSGTVVECDGDTVYVTLINGVEMDFPRNDLTATPPAGKAPAPAAGVAPARILTAADITPEHRRVLAIIPQRTIQSVASLYERRPKAGRFSALDVAQKLNFIASVTGVPYRTMKEFSDRPGELGLMMGRGLSLSLGSAQERF
jgi:hypothetical protein